MPQDTGTSSIAQNSPSEFRVRSATPGDVPGVLPMVGAICALHETWDPERYPMLPDVVERYRRWLPERARDPRSVFVVAEQGEKLVGFLVATIEANIPIYRLAEFGFIHDVWVEPDARGNGAARAMVRLAMEKFRELGTTQVRLETAAANEAARRLFASCGFRVGTVDMLAQLRAEPG